MQACFAMHGTIAELHLPMDADTRRGKGFAYVRCAILPFILSQSPQPSAAADSRSQQPAAAAGSRSQQ